MLKQCPAGMVQVSAPEPFCIDRYEYPNKKGAMPLGGTGFDEAESLCLKENKRLCSIDQWSMACAGPKKSRYAYGNTHTNDCNDALDSGNSPEPSGNRTTCMSGFGAMDMSGNLFEWAVDADPRSPFVFAMGGSYKTKFTETQCSFSFPFLKDKAPRAGDFGFRCCWSPDKN